MGSNPESHHIEPTAGAVDLSVTAEFHGLTAQLDDLADRAGKNMLAPDLAQLWHRVQVRDPAKPKLSDEDLVLERIGHVRGLIAFIVHGDGYYRDLQAELAGLDRLLAAIRS